MCLLIKLLYHINMYSYMILYDYTNIFVNMFTYRAFITFIISYTFFTYT